MTVRKIPAPQVPHQGSEQNKFKDTYFLRHDGISLRTLSSRDPQRTRERSPHVQKAIWEGATRKGQAKGLLSLGSVGDAMVEKQR